MIGMPEARIILAEAALAVATAPKSNASYNAINAALADVDAGLIGQVPLHLRNAPTALMKSWGNHESYRYAQHRSMYSYVRLSIDRCTATYV